MLKPVSPYGATKALGEHLTYLYFRNYGVPTVNLRYFSVYGPRQRPDMAFHRAIEAGLEGRVPAVRRRQQTRDFTYVEDIVQGTTAAAEHAPPGSTYNLGGGSRVSMLEVVDFLGQEIGALNVVHEQRSRETRGTRRPISRPPGVTSRMRPAGPLNRVCANRSRGTELIHDEADGGSRERDRAHHLRKLLHSTEPRAIEPAEQRIDRHRECSQPRSGHQQPLRHRRGAACDVTVAPCERNRRDAVEGDDHVIRVVDAGQCPQAAEVVPHRLVCRQDLVQGEEHEETRQDGK